MTGILHVFWLLPGLFIGSFLPWYFFEEPKRIIQTYLAYAAAFNEVISIPFLLKTLLSPWKSIVDSYPSNKLNFGEIMQVFTLNCTTRVIGLIFRTVALSIGLSVQIILLAVSLAYLLAWFLYPGVLVAGLAYLMQFSF